MPAEIEPMPGMTQIDWTNILNEQLIEEIWSTLSGQVTRDQVRQVTEAALIEFQDASVVEFIPILLRRRTYERLIGLISQQGKSLAL